MNPAGRFLLVLSCLSLLLSERTVAQGPSAPPGFPEDMGLANSLAFSPDRKLLACGCCGPYNDAKDYDILQIWDVATGRKTARLKTYGFAAFSPDGKTLAGRNNKGRLRLREARSHRIRFHDEAGPYFNVLAFSPDRRLLLTGSDYGDFTLRDVACGRCLQGKAAFGHPPEGDINVRGSARYFRREVRT